MLNYCEACLSAYDSYLCGSYSDGFADVLAYCRLSDDPAQKSSCPSIEAMFLKETDISLKGLVVTTLDFLNVVYFISIPAGSNHGKRMSSEGILSSCWIS